MDKPSDHCLNCLRARQEKEAAALAAAIALAADPVASVAELKRICALNPPSRKRKNGMRWTLNLLRQNR